MYKEIIINVGDEENRVAVLEDKLLVEMFIERSVCQRVVGNIFKGRVENVLPGMQAAFVDIGLEKNAFLYVEDAYSRHGENGHSGPAANICDVVKQGQDIIVQVVKEPIGTKGARVTTQVTLPGRYLVLMPTVDYIGISRRIEDEEERERLRDLAAKIKPEATGVIVRTAAEGVMDDDFMQDIKMLNGLWKKIVNRSHSGPVPNLLHSDLGLVQRILRDIFTEDVDRLTIDSRPGYEKAMDLLDIVDPGLKFKVVLEETGNIFEDAGIEKELEKALKRKVWLKCGGYLIIDQAEALTAIDVNTGKYVGSTNLEDTVLKTNLDAAAEIARQMRLRNLGGIIIIDFIDMIEEGHRQQVLDRLEEEIKKDKTKANILGLTQLGLVEMTRKKVRPSLSEVLQKPCPYCEGRGKVLSEETLGINFKNQILQLACRTTADTIAVEAHPQVAARLIGSGGANLRDLENKTGKHIYIRGSLEHHIEAVKIEPLHNEEDVQAVTLPVHQGQVMEVKVEEPHISNLSDGIARISGFILDIEGAGSMIGETIPVEIGKVHRTYAKARVLG